MFIRIKLNSFLRKISLCTSLFILGGSFTGVVAGRTPGEVTAESAGHINSNSETDNFAACSGNTSFNIGQGMYDITGPAAELGMMGHGDFGQTTQGIHMRLRARAFVIESPCNGKRLAFVSADLGMIFQSVKQGVVKKLKERFGSVYSDNNVMLSATHTHSGPGGYSHYLLYNATTLGHDLDNYEAIIEGIVNAIAQAQDNIQSGTIKMNTGDIENVGFNRSTTAYNMNPLNERQQYAHDIDKEMTLLKFVSSGGRELGVLNWLALHPTNFSGEQRLITGDNKGFASYLFEKDKGTNYFSSDTFVAAFAQANHGDVSPNLWGPTPGLENEFIYAEEIGTRQYTQAMALYDAANANLTGGVDYRHTHVNMALSDVSPAYTGGLMEQKTCKAAMGASFAAGSTEDQPGWFGEEGLIFGVNWAEITLMPEAQECHAEKPILLPTGYIEPTPWTPEVLPVQLATVGNLAIVAVPFECTTMCGRRLRSTVADILSSKGITQVVIAGMSNAYVSYVTTREEYSAQQYEGGSTQFGPWTLAAYREEVRRLARALRDGSSVEPGPTPRDLSNDQADLTPGVLFDDVPPFTRFGDVYEDAGPSYDRGEVVQVVFWGAHPRNNLRIQDTYLEVQQEVDGVWMTVARDWDPETIYRWARDGIANSKVTIQWSIPIDAEPGQYRIRHKGDWKSGWTGAISSYTCKSRAFTVN